MGEENGQFSRTTKQKQMKIFNNIINLILRIKYHFKIGKINKLPKGKLLFKDDFSDHKKYWRTTVQGNWGSIYPDGLSCAKPTNVEPVEEGLRLWTRKEPEGIVGKDFQGNKHRVYYSHAELQCKFNVWSVGWFECDFDFPNSGEGSWDAFWVTSPNYEIDFFENKDNCEITTHDRVKKRQYKFCYPKLKGRHTITAHLDIGRVTVYIDGYKVFTTKKHWVKDNEVMMRFTTGVGRPANDFPYYFTVKELRYYKDKRYEN